MITNTRSSFIFFMLCIYSFISISSKAQDISKVDTRPFADAAHHWYDLSEKTNVINPLPGRPQYKPSDLLPVADNILLYQKTNGGWRKNYDVMAILTPRQKDSLLSVKNILNTTFDNGTTYTHIAVLCQAYTLSHDPRYLDAINHGLDFIFNSQYDNGGWPQYYPLEENYSRHITFNDGAFEGIMELLKDIIDEKPAYLFFTPGMKQKVRSSFDSGLKCILGTQINDAGKPTAWCQQYDEITLQPAWARKFEPPSICNGESSDIVLFLMSIKRPDTSIIAAIDNAVQWFRESAIMNTRLKTIRAEPLKTPYLTTTTDKIVVTDSAAPPIWTRYYELKTHRPLFCNRDSKVVYSLAEVDRERRDGYGWYTYGPQKVLGAYPKWKASLDRR